MTAQTEGASRVGLSAAALALGLVLFAQATWWRQTETSTAAAVARHLGAGHVVALRSGSVLLLSSPHPLALELTSACSSAYLLAALLVVSSPAFLVPRLSAVRMAVGLSAAAIVIVTTNLLRLTVITSAVEHMGTSRGLEISHDYLGTTMTFVGTCIAGIAFAAAFLVRRPQHTAPSAIGV